MDLYLFAEHDDLADYAADLNTEIEAWAEPKTIMTSIYRDIYSDSQPKSAREIEVGIELTTNKAQKLKEPLNFLYTLAKKYHCDFSVGIIGEAKYQDVCFFGDEEGRPDMYEIANYLEL